MNVRVELECCHRPWFQWSINLNFLGGRFFFVCVFVLILYWYLYLSSLYVIFTHHNYFRLFSFEHTRQYTDTTTYAARCLSLLLDLVLDIFFALYLSQLSTSSEWHSIHTYICSREEIKCCYGCCSNVTLRHGYS